MALYVISAVVGAVYGIGAGILKYILLWKKVFRQSRENGGSGAEDIGTQSLMIRMFIGYFINAIVLLIVFFVRNALPLDFVVTIIATAIGLSIAGKFYSLNKLGRTN